MAHGKHFRAYLVGAFSALGGFLFGYHTGVISGVLITPGFRNITKINNTNPHAADEAVSLNPQNSAIVAVLLIGCIIGSLIGGQTSDRFSRKYSISIFSFIFTIGAALQTGSTVATGLPMLLVARFISGIAIGALSMIVPVYHSEIATTEVRGRIITFQQWAITIGIAVSFWINYGAAQSGNLDLQWRLPLGLQMVPSLILAVGILFCPFSPRWLISHDREDEARDVLLKIRSASHDEIEEEMDRIKAEVAHLRENEIDSYRQLFHPPLRRPFLLGVGIQILQQLTGINATIYYAPVMFGQFSSPNSTVGPLLATGVHGTVNVLATIPTIILIDKLGRRVPLIAGAVTMALSMAIVSILTHEIQVKNCDEDKAGCSSMFVANLIFIYIFVAGFAFSWGPIAWIYCTEIYPLTMRAKATSLTTAANWLTNCCVSFIALWLIRYGHSGVFITSSIFCALMIVIVYTLYPETKDMHLERTTTIESSQLFIPPWLENKRKTYNTFQQPREPISADQTRIPVANEQKSPNQSNQLNTSNSTNQDDDHPHENDANPNDSVN